MTAAEQIGVQSELIVNESAPHHFRLQPKQRALRPDVKLGKQDFSIAVWVHTEAELSDVLGDILSQYAPATRTGLR